MAKGNDGNYLQHCIEVEAAARLAKADPDGRLHIALTHGMAPFESLDKISDSIQKDLLYRALKDADGKPQSNEPLIVRAYRDAEASREHYPNTAELLRVVVGAEKLSGGITEVDSKKYATLAKAWSNSEVDVECSSWRSQLMKDGILNCPVNLDKPWIFSMDPMSYREECGEDDDYIYLSDLENLQPFLKDYSNSEQPGAACFFVYNVDSQGSEKQEQFWSFIDEIAKFLDAQKSSFWIPHNNRETKSNLAGILWKNQDSCLEPIPFGVKIACGNAGNSARSSPKLNRQPSSPNVSLIKNQRVSLMSSASRNRDDIKSDNERRIERMNYWINLAFSPKESHHVRFLFYWIAYEAAYQKYTEENAKEEYQKREEFHKLIVDCEYAIDDLQYALKCRRKLAIRLLELRQASRSFWKRQEGWPDKGSEWERKFQDQVIDETNNMSNAIYSGEKLAEALDSLFGNLAVVRNQIVHGGSAGKKSFGRAQVIWGTRLLRTIVPAFRDLIKANMSTDWGKTPFPRVGDYPNQECPPPWVSQDS